MTVSTHVLDAPLDYDGSQLASLFAYRTCGIAGDSAVAFRGACRVTDETMVDVEDRRAGARIAADDMLHVVAEAFDERLPAMVLRQRLFGRLAADLVAERSGTPVRVAGDDLFVGDGKLSISVATASPVSALFHFGLNLSNDGTPVETAALGDLGVEWRPFADELLARWAAECADVRFAAAKVRWVR